MDEQVKWWENPIIYFIHGITFSIIITFIVQTFLNGLAGKTIARGCKEEVVR